MNTNYIFVFAVGIGVVAGLRAMTAPAAVSWAAYLGWLEPARLASCLHGIDRGGRDLFIAGNRRADWRSAAQDSKANRTCTLGSAYPDGRPLRRVPLRISQSIAPHRRRLGRNRWRSLGAFGGYEIRRRLVSALNIKDIFIALPEDLIAIGLACFFVFR